MKNKICVIIVTYNRKNLLIKCLKAIREQTLPVDAIYVVDNDSDDGTAEELVKNRYLVRIPPKSIDKPYKIKSEFQNSIKNKIIKITYIKMNENTGGAGGFYEGMKTAFNKGYNWYWLMDDDSVPHKNALKELSKHFDQKNVSAFAGMVKDTQNNILKEHRGYFDFYDIRPQIQKPLTISKHIGYDEIDFASFVGILIKNEAIKDVGLPKKEFFIYYDDIEYSIRLKKVGRIMLIKDSVIIHPEKKGSFKEKNLFGKEFFIIPFSSYWLRYYDIRNMIWLEKKYTKNKKQFWSKIFLDLLENILHIIFIDDNKIKRIELIYNAYWDGLKGNFDNDKPKRILYD